MGQIFLIRHGQASFGSTNYDQLSARGVEQAGMLGKWFAQRQQGFDRIVTGTMTRHRQTAQACIGAVGGMPGEGDWLADAGFNEYDHDEVLHRHRPEFAEAGEVRRFLEITENANRVFQGIFQAAMARWMDGAHDSDYREPWPVFRQRCVDALERLAASAAPSQSIAVFTSGGTIATLCQHLLHLPDSRLFNLNWALVNSAVTKLYYQAGDSELSLGYLNNYAHLETFGDRHDVTYR
ncbi:MAG: histidine phosphatase family protein [Herminiimonas sp.]|nr:histidine phosphatase family protein [Herminiimonas sp.]